MAIIAASRIGFILMVWLRDALESKNVGCSEILIRTVHSGDKIESSSVDLARLDLDQSTVFDVDR